MQPTNLIEKDKIIDRVTQLFVTTDQRDWPLVEACFAEHVHFDQTSLVGGEATEMTPAEITAGWDKGLKPLRAVHHQIGNLHVALEDNEAVVTCYGIAYHYLPNSTGRNTRTFVGSYEFHLTQKGEWKIDSFVYRLKFIEGNTNLEKDAGIEDKS